ncbi:gamma-tubulin complex component 6-like isoform X2 [Tigriopus californicus]|uniref:gamma-tubulin complex component 6-like isoform X2 n=1 Tax=Tigriopus californicus TaxID=6832 RepID=UPI0027DA8AF3|nr:gamma-tubulin complex component 6-like isoform X2 [Tigriopus californicus]
MDPPTRFSLEPEAGGLWADLGRLTTHLLHPVPLTTPHGPAGPARLWRSRAMHTLLRYRSRDQPDSGPPTVGTVWDQLAAWCFQLRFTGHSDAAAAIQRAAQARSKLADAAPVIQLLVALAQPPTTPLVPPTPSRLPEPGLDRAFYDTSRTGSAVRPYSPITWPARQPPDGVGPARVTLPTTPGTGLTFLSSSSQPADLVPIPPLAWTLDEQGRRGLRCARPPPPPTSGGLDPPDEGYDSPPPAAPTSPQLEPNLWLALLSLEISDHRTWEALGTPQPPLARPYLTEMGLSSMHHVWRCSWAQWQHVDPSLVRPDLVVLPAPTLLRHMGYLMMGIESQTFGYHQPSQSFHCRHSGLTLPGLSPEAVASALQELLVCGAFCRRLEQFSDLESHPSAASGPRHVGLVLAGFLRGLGQYLRGYRTAVLNIVRVKTRLLDLLSALRPLAIQIQFLGRLCQLGDDHPEPLPVGIQLLCYLFDRTLHIHTQDLYYVMVSLLKQSAHPYFRFLERWIFQGMCQDEFNEFGIGSNAAFLMSRNRMFWTNAHTVADLPLDASICGGGNFINEIQHQVYVCGKSMHLLKLCSPAHHLCSPLVLGQPTIQLLVTPIEQTRLKANCAAYVQSMRSLAEDKSCTLKKQLELELAEEKEVLQVARRRHKEQLDKIREHRKSVLEQEDRRKRLAFEELRDQMLEEKRRKEAEKELKRAEDRQFARLAAQKAAQDVLKEQAEKAEQEALNQRRMRAAHQREIRNDWRIRRMELKSQRILFWRKENKKTQVELKRIQMLEDEARRVQQSASETRWKRLKVKEDEQRNIVLVLEDEESNVVTAILGDFFTFSDDMQHRILTEDFNTLPVWVREQCLSHWRVESSSSSDSEPQTDSSRFSRRSSKLNSSQKRKRPDSFIENAESDKKIEALDNLAAVRKPQEPPIYVSLSSALEKSPSNGEHTTDDNGNPTTRRTRARPTDLSVIDGRRRAVTSSKTIEEVLYPSRFAKKGKVSQSPITPSHQTQFDLIEARLKVRPYAQSFPNLGAPEVQRFSSFFDTPHPPGKEFDPQAFTPLSMLMENSILIPLRAQLQVVNESMLNYMLVEAQLMDELKALRSYLLLHDGEFAQHLARSIFSEVSEAKTASEILNPVTLNRIVENSLMTSVQGRKDGKHGKAQNVGFTFHDYNDAKDILDCLKLGYRTTWPTNIIITPETVEMYGDVFKFLLQLRKAAWGLEQVFFDLKHLRGLEHCSQIRQIHLMRHEMLNFVTITQDYVTTQVLDVSWGEFEKAIREQVKSLDSLYDAHMKYLNKILFRCILNKKAKPVQKIIIDIFNIVVKFSLLLTSQPWILESGEAKHPAYSQIQEAYRVFQEYSKFLYTEWIFKRRSKSGAKTGCERLRTPPLRFVALPQL